MKLNWLRLLALPLVALLVGSWSAAADEAPAARVQAEHAARRNAFVVREGAGRALDGRPFRFAGANNYYPMYVSQFMGDSLFDEAQASGFDVMRVWGSLLIGNADGSNSVDPSNTS